MISPVTGEVVFSDGLHLGPHESLSHSGDIRGEACSYSPLPIPGLTHHVIGVHASDHGSFEIEVVSDPESRIQMVFLAHSHPFYLPGTPNDSERRAFHEGILV